MIIHDTLIVTEFTREDIAWAVGIIRAGKAAHFISTHTYFGNGALKLLFSYYMHFFYLKVFTSDIKSIVTSAKGTAVRTTC